MAAAGKKTYLSAEAILGNKPAEEDLDVPEWGGRVHIKALDAETGGEILESTNGGTEFKRFNLLLVFFGLVEPAFTEEQLTALSKTSFKPILEVGGRVAEISGLTDKAVGEAGKGS